MVEKHSTTDEQLIQKFIEGDQEAFRQLVERYETFLVSYLFRFTGRRELAEEVAQETFMLVFQNVMKFRQDASFRSWVYAIATNRASNFMRRKTPAFDEQLIEQAVSKTSDPFGSADEQERALAVQQALNTLPEKQRAIFILRFYQGLSYEEISAAIGCPIGTVKSRMCYAMEKLRGLLWQYREK